MLVQIALALLACDLTVIAEVEFAWSSLEWHQAETQGWYAVQQLYYIREI